MINNNEDFLNYFPIIVNYLSNNDLVQLSSMNMIWKTILKEFRTVMWINNKSMALLVVSSKANDLSYFYTGLDYKNFILKMMK
jgi:hypothetical protein